MKPCATECHTANYLPATTRLLAGKGAFQAILWGMKAKKPTQCVIYKRVSTTMQEQDGVSLDAQEASCRRYAEMQGWEVAGVFGDVMSGGRDDRPQLNEALDVCRKQKATLLCYSLSRVSRSTLSLLTIVESLKGFVSISEQFDVSTPVGRLMLGMLANLAEFERETIAARIRDAMTYARHQNKVISGHIPYGYRSDDGETLVPVIDEQQVLERIRIGHAAGKSLSTLCGELNEEGVPAKHGGIWKRGTMWGVIQRQKKLAA